MTWFSPWKCDLFFTLLVSSCPCLQNRAVESQASCCTCEMKERNSGLTNSQEQQEGVQHKPWHNQVYWVRHQCQAPGFNEWSVPAHQTHVKSLHFSLMRHAASWCFYCCCFEHVLTFLNYTLLSTRFILYISCPVLKQPFLQGALVSFIG